MKALIVEIKGNFAAALSEDGSFTQIKNDNYTVGQSIEINTITVTKSKQMPRIFALAACFMLICGLCAGIYTYTSPVYYVSMDINPSVEYTMNTFGLVLSVEPVNDDGTELLKGINLKDFNNKSIDKVLKLTLEEIAREGYFDGDFGSGIVLATSCKKTDSAEKMSAHLKEFVTEQCSANQKTVSVESITVSQSQLDDAKALGVTPGKLLLVQKLLETHPHEKIITTEAWLKKPIWEIMSEMKRLDALDNNDEADSLDDVNDTDTFDDADDVDKSDTFAAAKEDTDNDSDDEDDAEDDNDADEADNKPTAPIKSPLPTNHNHYEKPTNPNDLSDLSKKPEPEDNDGEANSNDNQSEADSNDNQSEAGSNDNHNEAGSNDNQSETDSNDNQSETGSNDNQSETNSNDNQSEAGSNDNQSEADSNDNQSEADSNDNQSEANSNDNHSEADSSDNNTNSSD